MTEREAIIILNMLSGIGYSRYKILSEHFGGASKSLTSNMSKLSSIPGIGDALAAVIAGCEKSVDLKKELSMAERGGAKIYTIIDEGYPAQLKEIQDPPLCLYVKGDINCDFNSTIAVVGSRKMTMYGKEATDLIASQLAYASWTIISGLAYGVDAAVHQAVVNAKGRTIGVLGGGLARFHPQDHVDLARKMIEYGGGVISEFPMECSPTRRSFPMRNRVISGLSRGVVVTEAGLQSGALITVDFALEQNRVVFAVPGRINNPSSQGCNRLIKNGAKLVESVEDIFEEFEFLPGFEKPNVADTHGIPNPEVVQKAHILTDDEKRIIGVIANDEKEIDLIAGETGFPIGQLLALLQQLEIKKVVKQLPGKIYKINN
jgi:DNA processing protein